MKERVKGKRWKGEPTRASPDTAWFPLQLQQLLPHRRQSSSQKDCQDKKDSKVRHNRYSTKLKNSPQRFETGMAAEAVADRSGSGLTNATPVEAVVLDTEVHVWLDGGP